MNRDEALNKTIGILTYHQVNFCKSKEAVANMNEIIDALEKIDQEPCGDAVSRQAVLDTIGNVPDYDDGMVWEALSHAQRDVALLPSVTPQPKMGRWNFTKHYGRDYYVCSFCGMERMDDHSSGWNYCPNCGAKMSEIPTGAEGSEKE